MSDSAELAEPTLNTAVTDAQAGDDAAIHLLYRTLQPKILNYLRSRVGDTDAEDVASETWSRITQDLHTFHGDATRFTAWAITIARHRAIDHIRRRRPDTPLSPQDIPHQPAHDDPAHEAITAINTTATLAVIAELPTDQAQAILLRIVIGLDAPTAGKILGKQPGAIRTATYRGLRNLAARLAPHTTDDQQTSPTETPSVPTPRHTKPESQP